MVFHPKQLRRQNNTSSRYNKNNTTHNPPNHGQLLISVPPAAPRPKKITTDTIKGTDGIKFLRTISIFLKGKA